jgi:hypothetical protein
MKTYIAAPVGNGLFQVSKLRDGGSYSRIGTASKLREDLLDIGKLVAAGKPMKPRPNEAVSLEECEARIAILEATAEDPAALTKLALAGLTRPARKKPPKVQKYTPKK